MSKEQTNVPKLRFLEFTGPWEHRKLSELIIEYKETVDSNCTLPVLTSSKTEGVVLQEEHFGRAQNHEIAGYNVLPRNYCTYRNRSDGVDFTFNINKCCDKGIISKFYPVFYGNNCDTFFISMVLNYCDEVVHEIAYTCTGTSQKVLSFLDLQKMNIRVPSYEEQYRISKFFETLDTLITLQQRKLDQIKEYKKGMLQKMFPKEGETVPEVRFPGFTGEWERHTIGDVAGKVYGGGTPKTSVDEYWEGDIPWIQSSNVSEHELFFVNVQKYITESGLRESATQLVPANSIAVVSHVGVGKLVFVPFEYTTSQDFISLSDLKSEPVFTSYALYKRLQEDQHIVQGSAIKGITKNVLLSKEVLLPNIAEQNKIGKVLQNIDTLISLHQRKLDAMKEYKKGLLQQMFV